MKINSLYIHAFGGLKNLSLSFADGMTVIYGDNEQGKSTVMAFIKMMFYGSGRATNQLSKNIRQKYTPWDGSQMAGTIDFEHAGKHYRLEKEFRTSNSTDKATLCDLDFGTRQAVASDIGSSFFGISLPAFERSVFIGQLGYPAKATSAEGEINSKLSNMALTGEESVSFEEINAKLQKAKLSLMSKSGRAGEYDKNIKLMAEIEHRIQKAEELKLDANSKREKIAELEKEIENLSKKAISLKEKINTEQDVRNAEKLKRLLELKAELNKLNEGLKLNNNAVVDELYLRNLKFCLSKVNMLDDKITAKQNEIELLKTSINAGLNPPSDATKENAESLEKEISSKTEEKKKLEESISKVANELTQLEVQLPIARNAKKKFNAPLLIIGVVLALLGIISFPVLSYLAVFAVSLTVCGILLALALVFCVLAFVLRPNDVSSFNALTDRINRKKTELAELKVCESQKVSELSTVKAKLQAINTALNSSAAVIEKQQELLDESLKVIIGFKEERKTEEERLLAEFSKYQTAENKNQVETALEELNQKIAEQKELKQQLNFILNDLNGISYEDAEKKLALINASEISLSEDFDAIKNEYEQLRNRVTDNKSQIAALTAELRSAVSGAENPEALKAQLNELKIKTDSQKEFCLCVDIASALLTESFGELRRSYGSVLEKKASGIFEGITDKKYNNMSISKSLDINVEQANVFGSREIDYLSSGTADQAYLSMRLALAELMCAESEILPVFLDDSLTQYDDSRMKTALAFLKEYSQKTQIIMFTCHSSICEVSKEIGAECIKIVE